MDLLRFDGQEREVRPVTSGPAATHPGRSATWKMRAFAALGVAVPTVVAGLTNYSLIAEHNKSSLDIADATLATIVAAASVVVLTEWIWKKGRVWSVKPYWVAGRPAVRYETAAGDYIKFERYDEGVSANWSTIDGPQVLLSIPINGDRPLGQFWTSKDESGECPLPELALDLPQHKSEIIRAWVETDNELIVWRLADPGAAGIAQLGVLMRQWDPKRVAQLVGASATTPVQNAVGERLKDAYAWVTHKESL